MNGYFGNLETQIDNSQLQKCSTNEVNGDFNLYDRTSLHYDPATSTLRDKQSVGIGNYHLDNMYGCECGLSTAREIYLNQPTVNFISGGSGWMGENGCLIDNDSKLRTNNLTNKNYIHQLKNLQKPGFFGKGKYDVNTESIIRNGNITKVDKPCNVLSGSSTLQYSLTPMIKSLENTVQDTTHIVQEDVLNTWTRGGIPSRQIMKNNDYNNRCMKNR